MILYIFKVGIAEYLFRHEKLLERSIKAALYDKDIRVDDMEFVKAVSGWASVISIGSFGGYQSRFEEVSAFFADRLEEARNKSSELISKLL